MGCITNEHGNARGNGTRSSSTYPMAALVTPIRAFAPGNEMRTFANPRESSRIGVYSSANPRMRRESSRIRPVFAYVGTTIYGSFDLASSFITTTVAARATFLRQAVGSGGLCPSLQATAISIRAFQRVGQVEEGVPPGAAPTSPTCYIIELSLHERPLTRF